MKEKLWEYFSLVLSFIVIILTIVLAYAHTGWQCDIK